MVVSPFILQKLTQAEIPGALDEQNFSVRRLDMVPALLATAPHLSSSLQVGTLFVLTGVVFAVGFGSHEYQVKDGSMIRTEWLTGHDSR